MSKGLEAFKNIMKIYGETNSLEGTYNSFLRIRKDLERLEIIKSKNVDTFYLAYCFNCGGLERYNRHAQKYHIGTLKKQEFSLLKEVLCNDK